MKMLHLMEPLFLFITTGKLASLENIIVEVCIVF
jgi:hypothetical protein